MTVYILTIMAPLPTGADLFTAGSVAMRADQTRGGNYMLRALKDIEGEMKVAARRMEDALFVEYRGESAA